MTSSELMSLMQIYAVVTEIGYTNDTGRNFRPEMYQ